MVSFGEFADVTIEISDDYVATATIRRPPNNFFDFALIATLADAFGDLDEHDGCRAIVLASEGKHFCAGADFSGDSGGADSPTDPGALYREAVRLFSTKTPVVAAVQGAAVGGGLGLAMMPDFRIAAPEARFSANFAQLGFHHGFGLSETLPRIVGEQAALDLLYTGRRVKGEEALAMGLCDELVPLDALPEAANALAAAIATSGPLAVQSIRETMRGDLANAVKEATDRELAEQDRLRKTNDFKEGIRAYGERRPANFTGT